MTLSLRLPALPSRRRVLAVAAVVAQLVAAVGFPTPTPGASAGRAGSTTPFPCQDRPCGCPTADLCWAGDCCCFTMEQKLAWAEANGVEPPAHVRPAVEARKARAAAPKAAKKKACCSHDPEPGPASCCDRDAGGAGGDCHAATPRPDTAAGEPQPHVGGAGVRWVAGVFAQKCRGEGAGGLLKLDPAVPPALSTGRSASPAPAPFDRPPGPAPASVTHHPPTPPPRHS